MSTNFLVDFAVFNLFGLMAGMDWMVAFSAATFLAMMTSHCAAGIAERRFRIKTRRVKANHDALPANRHRR